MKENDDECNFLFMNVKAATALFQLRETFMLVEYKMSSKLELMGFMKGSDILFTFITNGSVKETYRLNNNVTFKIAGLLFLKDKGSYSQEYELFLAMKKSFLNNNCSLLQSLLQVLMMQLLQPLYQCIAVKT